MTECPATREAVEEQEEQRETGCPLCDRPAADHPSEIGDLNVEGDPTRNGAFG